MDELRPDPAEWLDDCCHAETMLNEGLAIFPCFRKILDHPCASVSYDALADTIEKIDEAKVTLNRVLSMWEQVNKKPCHIVGIPEEMLVMILRFAFDSVWSEVERYKMRSAVRSVCRQWKNTTDALPQFSTTKITKKNFLANRHIYRIILPIIESHPCATVLDIDLAAVRLPNFLNAIFTRTKQRQSRVNYGVVNCMLPIDTLIIRDGRNNDETLSTEFKWRRVTSPSKNITTLRCMGIGFAAPSHWFMKWLEKIKHIPLDTLIIECLGSWVPGWSPTMQSTFRVNMVATPDALCQSSICVLGPEYTPAEIDVHLNLNRNFSGLSVLGVGSLDFNCTRCVELLPEGLKELHLYRAGPKCLAFNIAQLLKHCEKLERIMFHYPYMPWMEPNCDTARTFCLSLLPISPISSGIWHRMDELFAKIKSASSAHLFIETAGKYFASYLEGCPWVAKVTMEGRRPFDGVPRIQEYGQSGPLLSGFWSFDVAIKPLKVRYIVDRSKRALAESKEKSNKRHRRNGMWEYK